MGNAAMASDSKMPLFRRKQSTSGRKKLEHQLYLARESPEGIFDLSECELNEIPSGVYSLCKVLQKDRLLLYGNWLCSLSISGGRLSDLENLRVLDVHQNELTDLPNDIGLLRCLQILNLEENKLTKLPPQLGRLSYLQSLNLRNNKLKTLLPECFSEMHNLQVLNLADNPFKKLPKELSRLRMVENLVVSADNMLYPSSDICKQGTASIMRFLCEESNEQYLPPNTLSQHVQSPTSMKSMTSKHSICTDYMDSAASTPTGLLSYERLNQLRRQQMLLIEQKISEEQSALATLNVRAKKQNIEALQNLVAEDQRMLRNLNNLQARKAAEHRNLVDSLAEAEASADWLVNQLLAINDSARRLEASLEEEERDAALRDQWFMVRAEEAASLRRLEVLSAMSSILVESNRHKEVLQQQFEERQLAQKRVAQLTVAHDNAVSMALQARRFDHENLIDDLVKDDDLQKKAFVELQLQKDHKTQRILQQIELIERELSNLTIVEMVKRSERSENELRILAEKRGALIDLLQSLMNEREIREKELNRRLMEMEEKRQNDEIDYWMVQYQRLLDRKPQKLMDSQHQLEKSVIQILDSADAIAYLPHFQRHRITIETLYQLKEEDLKSMGVCVLGTRKAILQAVQNYCAEHKLDTTPSVFSFNGINEGERDERTNRLTSEDISLSLRAPSAPSSSFVVARVEALCCICMEEDSSVIFINCGHVCCCMKCAQPLTQCPLCRCVVVGRVCLPHVSV